MTQTSRCLLVWLVLILTPVVALGGQKAKDEADGSKRQSDQRPPPRITLRLAVPRALPMVDREQLLVARLESREENAREVTVSFHWSGTASGGQIGADRRVKLVPGAAEVAVSQPWTPKQTGRHVLTARIEPTGKEQSSGPREATQTVTVVKRRLHFHYWDVHPSLEYITEGMVNDKDQLGYWADRGVIAQRWAGGKVAHAKWGKKTPGQLAEYWVGPFRDGWPGVVIDEFMAGGDGDEVLGRGLIEARKLEPKMYLAPYTVTVSGQQKVRGFREAADRVLIEAYEGHAGYAYSRILNRCKPAAESGLVQKAIVALGIGEALGKGDCAITTPQELRRQLHFTRYNFPNMPGVAFFSGMKPLYPALNELLRRFYIGPVLRAEVLESGRVRIENIGGDDAPAARVKIRAGAQAAKIMEIDVPPLEAGAQRVVSVAGEALRPVTEYGSGCMILGPPLPWDKEPAEYRPNATAEWPAAGPIAASVKEAFDTQPQLELAYDTSGKKGYDGNVSSASYPIPPTERRACQLQFDLHSIDTRHYGSISVGLVEEDGKSRLNLSLYRGDYEPGAYLQVSLVNLDGLLVNERIGLIIEPKRTYRLKARYEPAGYVRVAILDDSGQKLWDTGEIPTFGEMTFDRVGFGIRSGEGSALEWDPQRKAMLLRGTIGPQYVTSGNVDNLEVSQSLGSELE